MAGKFEKICTAVPLTTFWTNIFRRCPLKYLPPKVMIRTILYTNSQKNLFLTFGFKIFWNTEFCLCTRWNIPWWYILISQPWTISSYKPIQYKNEKSKLNLTQLQRFNNIETVKHWQVKTYKKLKYFDLKMFSPPWCYERRCSCKNLTPLVSVLFK